MATNGKAWARWLWIIVVVAAAAVAGLWYFSKDHTEPPQYITAMVSRGDLIQSVSANGQLNPVVNVQVGSQISGIIQRLFADFNSLVKSNQVVAQLDAATYQATVHQAEGDLANAKAALELQEVETRRSESLFNQKLISESDHQKALADLHQAQAQLQIKQASLERAQVDLARCTIYAPVDGIVISRNVDVGQTVAASMNAPTLFVIANDLSKMQIDANVSEADVGTVEEEQPATFTVDAYPNRTFNGKVVQIRNSPINVQNVVTYDTVIAVNNPDQKLKPGMTATVAITTAQKSGTLKIPNAALRFKPPEPNTNRTFVAGLLAKVGIGPAAKPPPTNTVAGPKPAGTNQTEAVDGGLPPLTGNEPPQELMRRVRDMRERGEQVPPEIQAKISQLFQSGAFQRPGGERGGRQGGGGPGGPGGAAGARPRPAMPAWRTIYVLSTNAPAGGGDAVPTPQAVRVRTGISDGSSTEIVEGLKEGDTVITSVKMTQPVPLTPPPGASPFGGGGGGRGRF